MLETLQVALYRRSLYWRQRRVRPAAQPSGGRPLVAGLFRASMGIGTGARSVYESFAAMGLRPASFDLTPAIQPQRVKLDWTPLDEAPDDGRGPVIVHVNGPEAGMAIRIMGAERLRGRYLIGMWNWELPTLPRAWRAEAAYFDEIWTPSRFTAESIRAGIGDKVRVTPYALAFPEIGEPERQAWRARLGLGDEFAVLAMFDAKSSLSRKNPGGAIAAFRQAFPDAPDVRLVLKAEEPGADPAVAALLAEARTDPRITVLTTAFAAEDMPGFYAAFDAFISLHRSEGFGLNIASALCMGTPVVATGWSSNAEFSHLPGAHDCNFHLEPTRRQVGPYARIRSHWAEPDIAHGAALLMAIRSEGADPAARGARARSARDHFSIERFAAHLGDRFKTLATAAA